MPDELAAAVLRLESLLDNLDLLAMLDKRLLLCRVSEDVQDEHLVISLRIKQHGVSAKLKID